MRKPALLAAIVIAVVAAIGALLWRDVSAPVIKEVRAHPVLGAQSAMVTLQMTGGAAPDRLVDVSSPIAKLALVKSPRSLGLPVPAGGTATLAMEAGHIMLMGLDGALEPGRALPMVLEFERAGPVPVRAVVSEMAMDHLSEQEAPGPMSVEIEVLPEGDGWRVAVTAMGLRFAPELADGPHVAGTGHGHLYVEGTKVARVFGGEVVIGALPPGTHRIEVVLNTNDHRVYTVDGARIAAWTDIRVE